MDIRQFEARKRDHITHALDSAHQAVGLNGLDRVRLVHDALPEINLAEVQLHTPCLGKALSTPFFVAGMTAGHDAAFAVNRTLALACQKRGWSMGVGSQRRELEVQDALDPWKKLRQETPDLVLFANIGISQLVSTPTSKVVKLVEALGAHALVIHTNVLQEALQPEGTPFFRGGIEALRRVCSELRYPVILKETGCGFSKATCLRLKDVGLAAIDVSGLGGTHWGRIEGARSESQSMYAQAAATFANWGEPTAESVLAAAATLGERMEIWASGGVRTGLDAAKLVALGAHRVGYAKPALEAALQGSEVLENWMETQEFELKTALFCTGSLDCNALRKKENVWKLSAV